MTIIADSGATKTDWCFMDKDILAPVAQTEGINPFHQAEEKIRQVIKDGLLPQLPFSPSDCSEIFFYGAGCIPPHSETIVRTLRLFFSQARISADSDLLGAARALCQDSPGIACILGTGSNSCLYDGRHIVQNISPLGYILGDEGSGAYLGKRFIGDCLKQRLSRSLCEGLLKEYGPTPSEILDKVYRQPQANRFLASITPYIYKHKDMEEVKKFLADCFFQFFCRNVLPYSCQLPVSFAGSVAWFFQDEIKKAAEELHITTRLFLKSPVKNLAKYHLKNKCI